MKIQTLYKRLPLPLLLTVIFATGIGVTPARSMSLVGSQNTDIDYNLESTLIAGRLPPCQPGQMPPGCDPGHTQQRVWEQNSSEKPEIQKPEIEKPDVQKPETDNRFRHQRQPQQQQQLDPELSPSTEQLPTVEPQPNNQ